MLLQIQRRCHPIAFPFFQARRVVRRAADVDARGAIAEIAAEVRELACCVVAVNL